MNSTAIAITTAPPRHDKNVLPVLPQDVGAAPKSWGYMHRIKWARALPVKPGGRLVAVAIADHINEHTGSWCISTAQLADETGLSDRAVRGHVYGLRAYFTIEDRPGRTWKFTIPPPLMAVVQPRQKLPNPPAEIADVPCKVPKTTTHTARARVSCESHGREWFEADGLQCYECARDRTRDHARPEGHRRAIPAGVLRQMEARRRGLSRRVG